MTRGFDEALQNCLDLIRDGQETIDSVVARYPEFSEELRPHLETALWLSVYKDALTPRPGYVNASRRRLVERIKQEKQQVPLTWRERLQQLMPMQRVAPVTFVFVLMLSLFVSGTIVSTSQKALPGDRMYGFKLTLEQLALATSLGEANDAMLQIQFVEERLAEVKALIAENRFEDVTQTASEFEEQVNKALLLIKAVAGQDPVYAKRLALELEQILANQRGIFTVLVKNVPPSVNLTVDQVLAIAEDYQDKVEVFAVFTPPTPIPTSPPPTPRPTLAPSSTPRPTYPTPTLAPTQKP